MENKINALLKDSLFKMRGEISFSEFKNIVKTLGWKMNYQKIHVVGTNGKGSVSKYLNDNLINSNKTIGLFTSPHIFNFEERIKINNIDIPFIDMQHHMMDIYIAFPDYSFGFFQLVFLACLAYFETKKIDIAIFEAGIGAKRDIVNYLNFDFTVFTSISLDHEKILGSTIEKIAMDKSYAIKKTNKIFYPNTLKNNLEDVLNERAKKMENKNINIVKIKSKDIHKQNQELAEYILKKEFKIKDCEFTLPIGRSQEIIINNIINYIDVGHNVEGIQKTLNHFKENNINFDQYVVSISSDKNVKDIMKNFDNKITFVYQNKSDRALEFLDYPVEFQKLYVLENFLKKLDKITLFIGSFYFIEEILRLVKYDNNSRI
ncbi:MAG: hypothetical protein ACRC7B_00700 [Metamycoplasmataceae bacterium]